MKWMMALLVACSDPQPTQLPDSQPDRPEDLFHAIRTCGSSWEGMAVECEVACQERPADPQIVDDCLVIVPNNPTTIRDFCNSDQPFLPKGLRQEHLNYQGCCILDRDREQIVWRECIP